MSLASVTGLLPVAEKLNYPESDTDRQQTHIVRLQKWNSKSGNFKTNNQIESLVPPLQKDHFPHLCQSHRTRVSFSISCASNWVNKQ